MRSLKYLLFLFALLVFSPAFSQHIIIKGRNLAIVRTAPHAARLVAKKMQKWGHVICFGQAENPSKKYCIWLDRSYDHKKRILFTAIMDESEKIYYLVKIYWEGTNGSAYKWDSYTSPDSVDHISSPSGLCALIDDKNLYDIFCTRKRNTPIPFERAEEDLRLDEACLERGGLSFIYSIKNTPSERGFNLHCRKWLFEFYGQKQRWA